MGLVFGIENLPWYYKSGITCTKMFYLGPKQWGVECRRATLKFRTFKVFVRISSQSTVETGGKRANKIKGIGERSRMGEIRF